MRYLCKFLFILWVTSSDNILRFLANSNFLNQQKGRGSLSVRKMNLRSHETSVSIVTQAICTGIFNQFLKPFSAKHFKRSILSHMPECKIFNRKKVALIITLKLKKIIPIESLCISLSYIICTHFLIAIFFWK